METLTDIENRFISKVADEASAGYVDDTMSGFSIKSLKKNITKAVKHNIKVMKRYPKRQIAILKKVGKDQQKILRVGLRDPKKALQLAAKSQKSALRSAVRTEVDMAKAAVKTGKAVAPVAAAAAAVYFGGPAVVGALKGSSAVTMLKGASLLSKVHQAALAKKAAKNPQAAQELYGQPPEVVANSPLVREATADIMREEELRRHGIAMDSDEARAVIDAQADAGANKLAVESTKPKKGGAVAAVIGLPVLAMMLM